MFRNKELTDENVAIYKRIVTRHLKELGVYSLVKTRVFSEKNMTFEYYIRHLHSNSGIVYNAVAVLWSLVDKAGDTPTFAASLFLMLVLSDENFFNMAASQCPDKEGLRCAIRNTVRDEINYLSSRTTDDWSNVSLEYANTICGIAKRVCNLEFDEIFQRLLLVNGFEYRK